MSQLESRDRIFWKGNGNSFYHGWINGCIHCGSLQTASDFFFFKNIVTNWPHSKRYCERYRYILSYRGKHCHGVDTRLLSQPGYLRVFSSLNLHQCLVNRSFHFWSSDQTFITFVCYICLIMRVSICRMLYLYSFVISLGSRCYIQSVLKTVSYLCAYDHKILFVNFCTVTLHILIWLLSCRSKTPLRTR